MANLNEIIQPERKTVSSVNADYINGVIFIDNSFQRRTVWTNRNKIRLIETILTDYPMPEIYFWQQPTDPQSGAQRYSVVDGQQRLNAITEYIKGSFRLNKTSLNSENRDKPFAGKAFAKLPEEFRTKLWNYNLNVRILPERLVRDEIVSIFLRLNETDKSLNPQELRNAQFNGKFISTAEELANLEFWRKWGVFTPAKVRRMNDIVFVSQLMAYLREGIMGDITPKAINMLYDRYNDQYRERSTDKEAFEEALFSIDALFSKNSDVASFFSSITHLYPLFIAVHSELANDELNVAEAALKLARFVSAYQNGDHQVDGVDLVAYRLASNEGLMKKSGRTTRARTILNVIS